MANEFGFDVVPVTSRGPKYHLFGYYGITPWDATGQYIVCLETTFQDHPPTGTDTAVVGLVELATGKFEPLAETRAFNMQQGSMLHWLPTAPDRVIAYNDRRGGRFVSVLLDIHTGEERVLPWAIGGMSFDGRTAAGLNYARLESLRSVVGYAGLPDLNADVIHPEDDGLFLLDLEAGTAELVLSHAQAFEFLNAYEIPRWDPDDMRTHHMWFNHTKYSRGDSKIAFIVRGAISGEQWKHSICMVLHLDSGRLTLPTGGTGAGHLDWRTPDVMFAYADLSKGLTHYLIDATTGEHKSVGTGSLDVLTRNGHSTFSPDGQWIVTDSGAKSDGCRPLLLWDMRANRIVMLGRFASPPPFDSGEVRCDLHPRWNRDGTQVCFDSVHEGSRQVYVVDVSSVVCP